MAGDTGRGATLTLATTGAVGDVQSMTLPEWAVEDIETSHLGTTNFKTFIPGDLSDPGEIQATLVFDATVAVPSVGSAAQTVTVTWPSGGGGTNLATLIGTGYVKGYSYPEMALETLQTATITVKFNGLTEPAYTIES